MVVDIYMQKETNNKKIIKLKDKVTPILQRYRHKSKLAKIDLNSFT